MRYCKLEYGPPLTMNAFTTYDLDDMINTIVGTGLDLFCVELILDLDQSVLDNFQSLDL